MTKTIGQGDTTRDLVLDSRGNLTIVTDLEGLRQKVKSRLRLFREEWFLDTSAGVPYLQEILTINADSGKVAGLIGSEIQKESGVVNISNVSANIDRPTRTFSYSCQVESVFGSFRVQV